MFKSDVGSGVYTYPSAGYQLPHAVAQISGTVNGIYGPTFAYDANGNMASGMGRTITMTSFNLPASIAQGSTTLSFAYSGAHARIKMIEGSNTTLYVNDPTSGAMAEKHTSGGTVTWRDYVFTDDGKLAALRSSVSGGATTWKYYIDDHLGSASVLTDASSNDNASVTERSSYDAWGRRRNADGSDDTSCSLTSASPRGYTGHEHLASTCLINANARVYDPTIARFMAADPITADWYDGQGINRFSYVNNRPLAFTDPTGLCLNGGTQSESENSAGVTEITVTCNSLSLTVHLPSPAPPPPGTVSSSNGQNAPRNEKKEEEEERRELPSCDLITLRNYGNSLVWAGASTWIATSLFSLSSANHKASKYGYGIAGGLMAFGTAMYWGADLMILAETGDFDQFGGEFAGAQASEVFANTMEHLSAGKTKPVSPLLEAAMGEALDTAKDECSQR